MANLQKITACAFLNQEHKLFVAKRAATKKFLPNKWELPGGHIEFGETMEEGLKREFKEEFQVEVNVDSPFYTFTYTREEDGKSIHIVEIVYFVQLANKNQQIQINQEDHSEYRWIKEKEIDQILDPANEETKAVKRGFLLLK